MIYPVELCKQMVAEYTSALSAVLKSQSYSIGGRSLSRANLSDIEKGLALWQNRLYVAKSGGHGIMMRRVIPHG